MIGRRRGVGRGVAALVAAVLVAGLGLVGLDRLLPPDLTRLHDLSPELRDHDGQLLDAGLSRDGMWRLAPDPDATDRRYVDLLLRIEDHRFYFHWGVDPLALGRAAWQLATRGHVVSGGSTLTMQVARLLSPHRHDLRGKLLDIARALQLERRYAKADILAMYLALAPFGGNVEGVRAASLIYFGVEPRSLTDGQAAMLVALPRSPTRLRPDRHPAAALAAAMRVFTRAGGAPEDWTPPGLAHHRLPRLAPHLAVRLASETATAPVTTTLDRRLQAGVDQLAQRSRPWLGDQADIAALAIDNRDGGVLAYLGGADYLGPAGMVDAVPAVLSPGSTLKPFIYGVAFDDSLLVPDTLIDDRATRTGDYAPRNFDRQFHGTVTVREALQQSYNLPAVAVLDRVGPARFAAILRAAGGRLVLPPGSGSPGLPIALGGVGIRMEDLARLYVGLARDGRTIALRLHPGDPVIAGAPLMSAAAAGQVSGILRGTPTPDGVAPSKLRPIAYKTGTSYGFHDAWAAGYSPRYTVLVWVGRKDGSSRPGAVGREAAAPLLLQIFDLLPPEPAQPAAVAAASTHGLAPGLRRMSLAAGAHKARAPQILYPPRGAAIDAGLGAGQPTPIGLEASGGTPPYRWAVDGLPLAEPPTGITQDWRPDGIGFARLSVIDDAGQTASETVRVK